MILDLNNDIQVLLTGSDSLLDCKQDIEEETVRDIAKIFDIKNLSFELKNSNIFKHIFKLSETGISLKNNIVTIKGFKELIEKLIDKIET